MSTSRKFRVTLLDEATRRPLGNGKVQVLQLSVMAIPDVSHLHDHLAHKLRLSPQDPLLDVVQVVVAASGEVLDHAAFAALRQGVMGDLDAQRPTAGAGAINLHVLVTAPPTLPSYLCDAASSRLEAHDCGSISQAIAAHVRLSTPSKRAPAAHVPQPPTAAAFVPNVAVSQAAMRSSSTSRGVFHSTRPLVSAPTSTPTSASASASRSLSTARGASTASTASSSSGHRPATPQDRRAQSTARSTPTAAVRPAPLSMLASRSSPPAALPVPPRAKATKSLKTQAPAPTADASAPGAAPGAATVAAPSAMEQAAESSPAAALTVCEAQAVLPPPPPQSAAEEEEDDEEDCWRDSQSPAHGPPTQQASEVVEKEEEVAPSPVVASPPLIKSHTTNPVPTPVPTPTPTPTPAVAPAPAAVGAALSPTPARRPSSKAPVPKTRSNTPSKPSGATSNPNPTPTLTSTTPARAPTPTQRPNRAKAEKAAKADKAEREEEEGKKEVGREGKEGRPSLGTMIAQYDYMRQILARGSTDEVEWLMKSASAGAYDYAHQQYEKALDAYAQSEHESALLERQTELTRALTRLLEQAASVLPALKACPKDAHACALVLSLQSQARKLLEYTPSAVTAPTSSTSNTASTGTILFPQVPALPLSNYSTKQLLTVLGEGSCNKASAAAASLLKLLPDEQAAKEHALEAVRRDVQQSMDRIELWSRREREAGDFDKCATARENKWLEANAERNAACLQTMRGLLPLGISSLTVPAIMVLVAEAKGCYTFPLVEELRQNRLLHWCITAPEDIAHSTFLIGPYAHFFESSDGLDMVETRALASVLAAVPVFDNDKDGRKAAWRRAFLQRAMRLAAQEDGESTKFGQWDAALQKRSILPLPPLSADQQRRRVYYYRPMSEMVKTLQAYTTKQQTLVTRRAALTAAETAFVEAKAEYNTVLVESRDAAIKAAYGADKLAAAKQAAKAALTQSEASKLRLQQDIKSVEAAIASAPVSMEDYRRHMNEVAAFLEGAEGRLIEGCFDEFPCLDKPSVGTAAASDGTAAKGSSSIGSGVGAKAGYDCNESIAERRRELEELRCHSPVPQARCASAAAASSEGASQSSQSLTPSRRVLQAVRPEMVTALEGLYRGQGAAAVTASKENAAPVQAAVAPKSRTLLKLLGKEDEVSAPVAQSSKPALSFLDQIRASKMNRVVE